MWLYTTPQSYDFFLKLARISGESFEKSYFWMRPSRHERLGEPAPTESVVHVVKDTFLAATQIVEFNNVPCR